MTNPPTVPQRQGEALFGDPRQLLEQLGPAEAMSAFELAVTPEPLHQVTDTAALRSFLRRYQSELLAPVELPAILKAHGHALRYELRELIALDLRLAGEVALRDFATASQRVGKAQLKRLRLLRDQRFVQRYLQAVQTGEAHGWHTVVFGIVLALYSLPLQQGLLGYALQTTRGFIGAAARRLNLSESDCARLMEEMERETQASVARLLGGQPSAGLLPV